MATYGKIGILKPLITLYLGYFHGLPQILKVNVNFNSNAFSITIRAVSWHMYKMIASMVCKQKVGI